MIIKHIASPIVFLLACLIFCSCSRRNPNESQSSDAVTSGLYISDFIKDCSSISITSKKFKIVEPIKISNREQAEKIQKILGGVSVQFVEPQIYMGQLGYREEAEFIFYNDTISGVNKSFSVTVHRPSVPILFIRDLKIFPYNCMLFSSVSSTDPRIREELLSVVVSLIESTP